LSEFRTSPEAQPILAAGRHDGKSASANLAIVCASRWKNMSDEQRAVSHLFI